MCIFNMTTFSTSKMLHLCEKTRKKKKPKIHKKECIMRCFNILKYTQQQKK